MRPHPLLAAALVVGGLTACSGSTSHQGATASAPTAAPTAAASAPVAAGSQVHELKALAGNRWSVSTLELKVGDRVMVTDADPDVPHNFVVEGVGRSPTLTAGGRFTLTFPKAGTFAFVCTFHESLGMKGTVTVR